MVHSVNGASLLVGGPGTCKTTCVNQFLGKFNAEVRVDGCCGGWVSLATPRPFSSRTPACCGLARVVHAQVMVSKTITFSSLTTPQIFQSAIEGAVEKRQGRCACVMGLGQEARGTHLGPWAGLGVTLLPVLNNVAGRLGRPAASACACLWTISPCPPSTSGATRCSARSGALGAGARPDECPETLPGPLSALPITHSPAPPPRPHTHRLPHCIITHIR